MIIKSTRNVTLAALIIFISATFQTVFAAGLTSSNIDKVNATTTSTEAVSKINLNTATADQLTAIKGIGTKTAEAIIAYREANGSFNDLSDLTNIKGIGPGTLTKVVPYLSL
jgi:competence protein ComEA